MTISEWSDADLVAGIVKRDSAALETLYDRYAASALGLALRILHDRSIAEDILQEAFWRVWKSAQTFDVKRGKFSVWLFSIVRNLAIDEVRRRGILRFKELDQSNYLLEEIEDDTDGLETKVWIKSRHHQVREAMKQLPDAQRLVIEMAYFEGLTRNEIAVQLGEPPGTIHTRARLGLQKLKTLLASWESRE